MVSRCSKEDFIKAAITTHGNLYDYKLVNYINNYTKVKFICSTHGVFEQTPKNHLNGNGCKKCASVYHGNLIRSNTIDFINKSIDIYRDLYDYSKTKYVKSNIKVTISCRIHGDFEKIPSDHLNGQGCPKCGYNRISLALSDNFDEFLYKANLKHNNFYDYSKVVYVNSRTKVIIVCPDHGEFEQQPNNHLTGQGCPVCSESKGERVISIILGKHNIKYEREYKIKGTEYKFRYDFYLPDYNLFIEFHGEQHYRAVDVFWW